MLTVQFPKRYGHKAFYIRVRPSLCFRVYKVEHLFSTVGEAHMITFHISFRHLKKLRQFPWADKKSISITCGVKEGLRIMEDLRRMGCCNLTELV